jgi:hypothetical protein
LFDPSPRSLAVFNLAARTIRLPKYLWNQVDAIAKAEGMSSAQLVRESVMIRCAYRYGQRTPGMEPEKALDELLNPARRRGSRLTVGGPMLMLVCSILT